MIEFNNGKAKLEMLKPYIDEEGRTKRILERLEDDKLVFIVGLQGAGKSRTAYEVACLSNKFPLALVYGKEGISIKICVSENKIRNVIIEVGFSKWEDIQTLLVTVKALKYIDNPEKFLKKLEEVANSLKRGNNFRKALSESAESSILATLINISPILGVLLPLFWPLIKTISQERDAIFNIKYSFEELSERIKNVLSNYSVNDRKIEESIKQLAFRLSSNGLLLIMDRAIAERPRESDSDEFGNLIKEISKFLKDVPDLSMIVIHTVPPGSLTREEELKRYISLLKRNEEAVDLLRRYYGDKLGPLELKNPDDIFVIEPPRDLGTFKKIIEINTGKRIEDIRQLYKLSAGIPALAIALVTGNLDTTSIKLQHPTYEFKTYDELRSLISECQEKFRRDEYEECLMELKKYAEGIKWTIDSSLLRLLRNLAISSLIAGYPYPIVNIIDLDKDPFQKLRKNLLIGNTKNECLRVLRTLKRESEGDGDMVWNTVNNEICNVDKMHVDEYVPMISHKNELRHFKTKEGIYYVETYTLAPHGEWIASYLQSLDIHSPLWTLPVLSARLMLQAFYNLYKNEFEIPEDYLKHVQKLLFLLIRTKTWGNLEKEMLSAIRGGLIIAPTEVDYDKDSLINFLNSLYHSCCLRDPFVYMMLLSEFIEFLDSENATRIIRSTTSCLKSMSWSTVPDSEKMYILNSLARIYSRASLKETAEVLNDLLMLSLKIYNSIHDNDLKLFVSISLGYLDLVGNEYDHVCMLYTSSNPSEILEKFLIATRKANQEIERKYGITANPEFSVIGQYFNFIRNYRHCVLKLKGLKKFCEEIELHKLDIPSDLTRYTNPDDYLEIVVRNTIAKIVCALDANDLESIWWIMKKDIVNIWPYLAELLTEYKIEGLKYLLIITSLAKFLEKVTNDKRYMSIVSEALNELRKLDTSLHTSEELTEEELLITTLRKLNVSTKAYYTVLAAMSLGYLVVSSVDVSPSLHRYIKEELNRLNDELLQIGARAMRKRGLAA